MKTIPVNFVGGENNSRSRQWSSQSTVNLYIDAQGSGRSQTCLLPWPGEKAFSSGSSGTTRGMILHNELVYLIVDTDLIEIDSDGTRVVRGTIPGANRCSLATDGTNLVIRTGSATYFYSTSVAGITDSNLENAQTLCYINNQFIYQGTAQRFGVSNAGDPTTIDGLNYATAESYPDDIVQVYAFNERVYIGGSRSMEIWYNSGEGSPPFDRIQQSTTEVGIASPFCMANSDEYLYFLGDDNSVYRVSAYQPESVTPSAIAKEFREATTSDAQGYCVHLDGQWFYIVQLPTSNLTLAYSEQTGEWIRLSTGVDVSLPRHLMNGYVYAFGKHLVCDYDSGDVYEWDFETYQSNGSPIAYQRDSAPVSSLQLAPGKRLLMSKADFFMETGVGNSDELDPEMMVSCSIDGASFTNEDWIKLGREGQKAGKIEWYNMQSFYDLRLRVRSTDPNFFSVHGAAITLKEAGW